MTLKPRNEGLDLARALAICLVLFIHLYDYFVKTDIGEIWYLGYLGIDIFFALSGFLIGTLLMTAVESGGGQLGGRALKRFLIRRWLRTLPLYYLMLALNAAMSNVLFHQSGQPPPAYFFFLQNFLHFPPSFFGESWSLAVEEWFYLSFAAGLWIFSGLTRRWTARPAFKILCYSLGYLLFFNLARGLAAPGDYSEYNIVIYRLDAPVYGVLAAILYPYFQGKTRTDFRRIGGTGAVLAAAGMLLFLLQPKIGRFYQLYYPLTGTGLALVIAAAARLREGRKSRLFNRPVYRISRLSYSLYLMNLPVIFLFGYFFPCPGNRQQELVSIGASLLLIFILSLGTYRWVEKPFLNIRERYFPAG